jgi:hypothetical protein
MVMGHAVNKLFIKKKKKTQPLATNTIKISGSETEQVSQ